MTTSIRIRLPLAALLLLAASASAQTIESTGTRALGMGGAFVAVANDSSATWWNPAALPAGPFLDLAVSKGTDTFGLTAAILPFGVGYYRFRVIDIQPAGSTGQGQADREERRAESLFAASQLGATLVHSLADGVHVGTTLKFVRGEAVGDVGNGEAGNSVDIDVGVLAVAGALRVGAVARNLRAPVVGGVRMDRQVRAGVAFDGEAAGGAPLMLALDADLRAYETVRGSRRVVAAGGERWLAGRRLGLRGGARVNTAGARETAGSAGASVMVRSGLYVDAHAVRSSDGAHEWGLAGRVSF